MAEVLGRYEILEQIGQGGFAIVYRARDTELERQVALKELRPTLLADGEWVQRFKREARTIAQLDHPRIVTIHDVVLWARPTTSPRKCGKIKGRPGKLIFTR